MMDDICEIVKDFKETYDLSVEVECISITKDTEHLSESCNLSETEAKSGIFSVKKYIFATKSYKNPLLSVNVLYKEGTPSEVYFPINLDERVSFDRVENKFVLK